jgi:O-antigen ligase
MVLNRITLFYISFFLILISSTIKKVESFLELEDRHLTTFVNIFAENSTLFTFISICISSLYIFIEFVIKRKFVRLPAITIIFILIKLFSLVTLSYYGEFDVVLAFSCIIYFFLSSHILGLNIQTNGFFSKISFVLVVFSFLFVGLNFYEIIYNNSNAIWAGRLFGITNHPNFVGGYAAILSVFVFMQAINSKIKMKGVYLLLLLSLVLIVLFSGSRSSAASLILGVSVCIFCKYKFKKYFLYLSLSVCFIVPLYLYVDNVGSGAGFNTERIFSTLNTRESIYTELWDVFLKYPFFGNPVASDATSNSYLKILSQTGLIGGIAFLSILTLLSYHVKKNLKYISSDRVFVTYLAALITILFYALFEGVLAENYSFGLVMFYICLAYFGTYRNTPITIDNHESTSNTALIH